MHEGGGGGDDDVRMKMLYQMRGGRRKTCGRGAANVLYHKRPLRFEAEGGSA
jgi:hypothetical protein